MRELDDENAEPAHTIRFGSQFDYQGVAPTNRAEVKRTVGYLTKYLTKSIADAYDPGTVSARQREHRSRLAAETKYLPCSPECPNWLRFGIQPDGVEPGMEPGDCGKAAHDPDNLGHGGRRVLTSRQWSGKTLVEHKADRAAVIRQVLIQAGIDAPRTDRYAADATDDDGQARYAWENLDPDDDGGPEYRLIIKSAITERNQRRAEYERARELIAARDGPPDNRSATQPAASDAA